MNAIGGGEEHAMYIKPLLTGLSLTATTTTCENIQGVHSITMVIKHEICACTRRGLACADMYSVSATDMYTDMYWHVHRRASICSDMNNNTVVSFRMTVQRFFPFTFTCLFVLVLMFLFCFLCLRLRFLISGWRRLRSLAYSFRLVH